MDLLDDLARRSAATLRAEAEALADTEVSLADVRSDVTVAKVTPLRPEARRWWPALIAAAVVVGIVAVGTAVVLRDEPERVGPADTVPTETTTTMAPPSAEVPVLTPADAEVLYDRTAGSTDPDQLGISDTIRPNAPIVLGDGTLILGDPVNARWVVIRGGVADTVAYADDNDVVWDAALGADGTIASLVYAQSTRGLVNGRVERATVDTLGSPTADAADLGDCCSRLVADGVVRIANTDEVNDSVVLADQSVVTMTPDPSVPYRWTVDRFHGDGAVTREVIDLGMPLADNVGRLSVGQDGISVLLHDEATSTFRVLRFPLPATVVETPPTPTVSTVVVEQPGVLEGEVLYTATVGAGDDQLGLEGCSECDGLAPLAPMVAPDGTIVIGDTFNRRWVLVRDGAVVATVSYPLDTLVYDAVMDDDGNVFWVEYSLDGGAPATLSAVKTARYDQLAAPRDLQYEGFAGVSQCCRSISFDGSGEPAVEDPTLTFDVGMNFVVREGLLHPTLTNVGDLTVRGVYVDHTIRDWFLDPQGLDTSPPSLHVLPDGSVVAIQTSPLSVEARVLHTVNHLLLDGTVVAAHLPAGVTTPGTLGKWSVTPGGVTTLVYDDTTQTFTIVRYPLPTG